MDLDTITEKIKTIPPIVWVGAGGVLLFIFFMGKGGGATDEPKDTSGVGGDGSGDFTPDIDQEVANLFALIREDAAARAAFQNQVTQWISGNATPTPSGPTSIPSRQPPSGSRTPITPLTPAGGTNTSRGGVTGSIGARRSA